MSVLSGTDFSLPGQTDIYRGKIHDVYTINDEKLISVVTDRLSAFGVVLPYPIEHKGQVINLISAHFLRATADIVPNWLQDVPDPNLSIGVKCEPFKVELVIRGCLVGHVWRVYEQGVRTICGTTLPDGMKEYDMFDEPIITPQTSARTGHDEDLSALEVIQNGYAREDEFERLSIIARQLFIRGRQLARTQGLVLADTKYIFGKHAGEIYLTGELHTPDSSRYFYVDEYENYLKSRDDQQRPKDLSKEFVRQWLLGHGFSGLDNQISPVMDSEFTATISKLYIELYERLIGERFVYPDAEVEPRKRIEKAILEALRVYLDDEIHTTR